MKKGISLITMMVAIVLMFIVSSIVIYNIVDSKSLAKVGETKFKSDLKKYDYEIRNNLASDISLYENSDIYAKITSASTISKYSKDLANSPYMSAAYIVNGKLALYGDKITDEQKEWATEIGISVDEEYNEFLAGGKNDAILTSSKVVTKKQNLYAYYDYTSFDAINNVWMNEKNGGAPLSLNRSAEVSEKGIILNGEIGNYAYIDIDSNKSSNDYTIYAVVRNLNKFNGTPHKFIFDIPLNSASQDGTTPHMGIAPSNNSRLYYSSFGISNDVVSTVNGTNYNVLAFKMTSSPDSKSGTIECFINGVKQSTAVSYSNFGKILYLSHSVVDTAWCGNNAFRMFAVYNEASTDEDIVANSFALKTKYIDNILSEFYNASTSSKVVTKKENLHSYFDYTSFNQTENVWKSEKNNGAYLSLNNSAQKTSDGVVLNGEAGNYAFIDIDSIKYSNDYTIYAVVKNLNTFNGSPHKFIFDIPYNLTGTQDATTPHMGVYPKRNSCLYYSSYGGSNDVISSVDATQFNVLAYRMTSTDDGRTGSIECFINGVKQSRVVPYTEFGRILYLSHSVTDVTWCGNNAFRMFAIYNEASTDEDIIANSLKLKTRYIEGAITDFYNASISSKVITKRENLHSYFDYTSFDETENVWQSEKNNGAYLSLNNSAQKTSDGVILNGEVGNYAFIDINSMKLRTDYTIYAVVKNLNTFNGSPHKFIFDIPLKLSGTQDYTTPHMGVYPSSNSCLYYSSYGGANDVVSSVDATKFNVLAYRMTSSSGGRSGTIECFINGVKQSTAVSYTDFGEILYLSHSVTNTTWCGNNAFRMFAIYNEASTDEEIIANSRALKTKYIDAEFEHLYTAQVSSKVVTPTEKLLSYFDYSSYNVSKNVWKSEKKNGLNFDIYGSLVKEDNAIKINGSIGQYAKLNVENRIGDDFTIYMVVKADTSVYGGYKRIFEMPKYPSGDQTYTTPNVCYTSGNISYGTYNRDGSTTIPGNQYNVIAMRMNTEDGLTTGTYEVFINGEKQSKSLAYDDFGNEMYLAYCTSGYSSWGGSHYYRVFAVYSEASSDADIIANSAALKAKYVDGIMESLYTAQISSKVITPTQNLLSYFDSSSYDVTEREWNNEKENGLNFDISGNLVREDNAIKINGSIGQWAKFDASTRIGDDFTIYMVVKADTSVYGGYKRIFEMPKYPSGNQTYTTPNVCYNSGKISYGTYNRDGSTTISGDQYNVIALRLDTNDGLTSGTYELFINGEKQSKALAYDNFGNEMYLAYCTSGYSNYGGSQYYRMFAVYSEASSDANIIANSNLLKAQYIDHTIDVINLFLMRISEVPDID